MSNNKNFSIERIPPKCYNVVVYGLGEIGTDRIESLLEIENGKLKKMLGFGTNDLFIVGVDICPIKRTQAQNRFGKFKDSRGNIMYRSMSLGDLSKHRSTLNDKQVDSHFINHFCIGTGLAQYQNRSTRAKTINKDTADLERAILNGRFTIEDDIVIESTVPIEFTRKIYHQLCKETGMNFTMDKFFYSAERYDQGSTLPRSEQVKLLGVLNPVDICLSAGGQNCLVEGLFELIYKRVHRSNSEEVEAAKLFENTMRLAQIQLVNEFADNLYYLNTKRKFSNPDELNLNRSSLANTFINPHVVFNLMSTKVVEIPQKDTSIRPGIPGGGCIPVDINMIETSSENKLLKEITEKANFQFIDEAIELYIETMGFQFPENNAESNYVSFRDGLRNLLKQVKFQGPSSPETLEYWSKCQDFNNPSTIGRHPKDSLQRSILLVGMGYKPESISLKNSAGIAIAMYLKHLSELSQSDITGVWSDVCSTNTPKFKWDNHEGWPTFGIHWYDEAFGIPKHDNVICQYFTTAALIQNGWSEKYNISYYGLIESKVAEKNKKTSFIRSNDPSYYMKWWDSTTRMWNDKERDYLLQYGPGSAGECISGDAPKSSIETTILDTQKLTRGE